MGKALDGADAIIESLTDDTKGFLKALADVKGKLTGATKITIQKAEYDKVGTAATDIIGKIDKVIEAGGLTQLDTSNLKAIKASVVDLKNTFENIDGITKNGAGYDVEAADFDKVKAAIDKITESSKEVGASQR